jgi:flagellar operon protein
VSTFPNPALVPPGISGPPAAAPGGSSVARANVIPATGPTFADVLATRTSAPSPPQFSRHALQRLQQRGIEVGRATLQRLTEGVARAAGKGARDSVVFVDNTAFVVSVANNTVITAVTPEHMRQHVFTNIDSAVIA